MSQTNGLRTNGDSGYILPAQLLDSTFYTSQPMLGHYSRLRWPVDRLDTTASPRLNTRVSGGPYDRTLLREIILTNTDGTNFAQLFAKVHHPGRHVVLGASGSNEQDLEERVLYEAANLRYWNIIGLPSPYFFDVISEDIPSPQGEHHRAHTLLMTRVAAPTHDLDILAIDDRIAFFTTRQEDQFINAERKAALPAYIRQLREERDKIVTSILRTQIRCQLLGTYHLPEIASRLGLDPKRSQDPVADELKAVTHYLRVHHLYDLVRSGQLPVETARENTLPHDQESHLQAKISTLTTFLTPILQTLYADPSTLRYIHGDEYIHHYAYKSKKEGEALHRARLLRYPLNISSVMLDANDARMGLPESGLAKTLLSHLLSLPPEKIQSFVLQYATKLQQTASSYEHGEKLRQGITKLVPSHTEEEFLDRFDLVALTILMRNIGLKAKDKVFNHERFDSFTNQTRPYNHGDTFVDFPRDTDTPWIEPTPRTVNYAPYGSEHAIPILKHLLHERTSSFLSRSRASRNSHKHLEEQIHRLHEFFATHGFYP